MNISFKTSFAAFVAPALMALSLSVSNLAYAESKVIANIDGVPITEQDFRFAQIEIGPELNNIPEAQRRLVLLEYLIENQLLAKAAEDSKIDQDPEFSDQLKYYQKRALRNIYFEKNIRQALTDDEVKKVYDAQIASIKPQEEVRASHILVKTEKEAQDIAAELSKGGDFAKIAQEKSIGPSKVKGGDLGYFAKDRMVKPFADAAFALKEGEISKPVQTQFGWHIIKKGDTRTRPLPTFEAIKERLRASLLQQRAQTTIESLRQKAKIDIVDKDLEKKMEDARNAAARGSN